MDYVQYIHNLPTRSTFGHRKPETFQYVQIEL